MTEDAPPRYYLDTSAQVSRNGGKTARDEFKIMLRGRKHATSTQVEREWNRIVYTTCVKLREALDTAQDWGDVVDTLTKGFGRAPARHWKVVHWITNSETTDLAAVRKRLDDWERIRPRIMFKAGIDEIRDGTDCDVARRRPRIHDGGAQYQPTCEKTQNICNQPAFLHANMERAMKAATALEGSPRDNDAKMGRQARFALEKIDKNGTKGNACHAGNGLGGDICIALECAEDEVLLTTDASFDLICPAIDRKYGRVTGSAAELGSGSAADSD